MNTNSHLRTRAQRKAVVPHPVLWPDQCLALADQYLTAYDATARIPRPPIPIFWPSHALLTQSVELPRKGMSEAQLRRRGHDIAWLLQRAQQEGLAIGQHTLDRIALLDDMHAEHWARYPKAHAAPVATIEQFRAPVSALFTSVREELGGWTPFVAI